MEIIEENQDSTEDVLLNEETLPWEQTETEKPPKKKTFLHSIWAILLLILSKFKALIILLKLGKFASTFLSMILMLWMYAKLYGLAFGVGFVLLLFVHEMGHYIAAKLIKLNVSLPLFIPFVGAVINLKEMPTNAEAEAKIGLGGPILGSLGAFLCMLLYYPFHQDFLLALAYTGFILNLFNLIPIRPLDGGRAVAAISPWLWLIGLPIAIIFLFIHPNPILILILILGIIEIVNQIKNPNKEYFQVTPMKRVIFALIYFGLLAVLGIGSAYIHGLHSNLY
jgi:Zn-dependent proteases